MDIRIQIVNAIGNGQLGANELFNKIQEMKSYGNDVTTLQTKFTVLNHLIGVMEKYYRWNYNPDNTPIDPPTATCLNQMYRDKCIININKLIGNKNYIDGEWILITGYWNDAGEWVDTSSWID
jgi:hypothetical protein